MNAKTPSPLQRLILMVLGGVGLFALALVAVMIGYHVRYAGKIYPGVRVGWVDVSGQTPSQAAAQLASAYAYPQQGKILLREENQTWLVSPAELGLSFSAEENAQRAYDLGRNGPLIPRLGAQFRAWYQGVTLPIQMSLDQRIGYQRLETIAKEINLPTIEASLKVDGTEVIVRPGQIGRRVDIPTTLEEMKPLMETLLDGEVDLIVQEDPPVILDVDEQAAIAREILSAPLTLKAPGVGEEGPGPWAFSPQDLGEMLVIERVNSAEGETYQVGLSNKRLHDFLHEIAPSLKQERQNARFIFNEETEQLELIQAAVTGQSLDVEASLALVQERVLAGEHTVTLDMEYTNPEVDDDATTESLGISELVSSHTTYFYGSSSSRRQNISTAAARFHGVLVAPGETFSMAEVLGNVSLDTGYAEAWIIYGDRTIKGVGGGVCQVSTTLFRTVFFGGYPIVERHPHAYRVSYYEQTYGGGQNSKWAGLDATVYVPVVDFQFTNDTDHWLLMETYAGPHYLTWKFYSSSDGREVDWDTTGLTNQEDPPEPLYEENEDLEKGEIKQTDWAIDGADVTVNRTVTRDGETLSEDTFKTHYQPWRAVCEYGPGTKGMPPEDPDPDQPCQPDSKEE